MRWRRRLVAAAEIALVVIALGALGLWCSVPNTARLADENPTSTAFIDLRRDQAADAHKKWKLQWQWRPLGKISRYLRAAVVYAEDAHFYTHEGVDWHALESARSRGTSSDGELRVGGSTITQQLAKNLYLSPSRNLLRKLREMLIAFSLEDHLSKQRILELYLNVVEWGDGMFGAEAAAQHWFGHSAQSLSPAEAARLAIALPNPFTRDPTVERRAHEEGGAHHPAVPHAGPDRCRAGARSARRGRRDIRREGAARPRQVDRPPLPPHGRARRRPPTTSSRAPPAAPEPPPPSRQPPTAGRATPATRRRPRPATEPRTGHAARMKPVTSSTNRSS